VEAGVLVRMLNSLVKIARVVTAIITSQFACNLLDFVGKPVPENPKLWFPKTLRFWSSITRLFVPNNPKIVPENPRTVPETPIG
jgi:hypothetical protein